METRDKILASADDLFFRYGIKSVTMDDIAKHLSMSKKTIYQYFKDKDEIVYLITEMHLEKDREETEAMQEESANTIEFLYLLFKCMKESFSKINPSVLFDLKKYHTKAWTLFLEYKKSVFFNSMVSALQRGIEEGNFREDIHPQTLAKLRLEEVQMPFDENIFPRDEYGFQETHFQLFDHFVHGIVTEQGLKLLNNYFQTSQVI